MPLPQISLSKKMIVLLAAAAALQLGIVVALSSLEYQAEAEADKAEQARQVHDSINQLIIDKYRIMSMSDIKGLVSMALETPLFAQEQSSIYKQFALLKELLKANPKELQVIQTAEGSSLEAMAILQQLKEMYERGDIQEHEERKPLLTNLRRDMQEIVSQQVIDVTNHQAEIAEHSLIAQQHLRHQARWLIAIGGLISLLFTSFLALFLITRVAQRLERILDNTERLAKHTALHPAEISTETDEIARLDKSFHEMAKALGEVTAKHASVVDNAGDMICSMDEDGTITSANAAGGKLFGCHPAELLGKNFRDVVHRQDVSLLSDYLQRARAGAAGKPVQVRLVGRGRRSLWVLWSARWTSGENQYFAVVHDLTQIQEAQRMKQEIVAIVTHDLKTPLTNLQEFLDLLEEGSIAKVEDRGRRFVASARRNTNQMLMLINDMIDLEKAKNGMLVLHADQLYLDDVIDQAQVVVGPFAEEKDVVLDCRRSGLIIKGEENKLRRVLTNLLGNAMQYAPKGSSILLVSKSQDGFAQVSISDKGPGMSPEQIATIFDAFSPTADEGGNEAAMDIADNASQGSGLGLAISKAFVELHGGKITVGSKVGEGTTIAFTLPLGAASVAHRARAT